MKKNNSVLEVKQIFLKYRRNKLWIENYDLINNSLDRHIPENELIKYKEFVRIIDSVLEELNEIDRWILKSTYINKKEKNEINYAESTFYWKLRKASFNFMELLKW